jgi:hypothetical protein
MYVLSGEGTDTTRHAHDNVSLIDMSPNGCSSTMRFLYDKSLGRHVLETSRPLNGSSPGP